MTHRQLKELGIIYTTEIAEEVIKLAHLTQSDIRPIHPSVENRMRSHGIKGGVR